MRVAVLLLVASAVLGANQLPREGAGWTGFAPGSWAKLKQTRIQPGRTPMVTLMTQKLTEVTAKSLTVEAVTTNALGMEQKSKNLLPRAGDAAPGEKQRVENVGRESVTVGGRPYDCRKVRTTVTGPAGKRVVTKWIADSAKLWTKKTEVHSNAAGDVTYRLTWMLKAPSAAVKVGARTVDCIVYSVLASFSGMRQKATLHISRAVPGGIVRDEGEVTKDGATKWKYRIELLGYGIK